MDVAKTAGIVFGALLFVFGGGCAYVTGRFAFEYSDWQLAMGAGLGIAVAVAGMYLILVASRGRRNPKA